MKERLAAVLINHWFTVQKAIDLGRLKREPRSKRYKELKDFDNLEESHKKATIKGFMDYTGKNAILNMKHFAERLSQDIPEINVKVGNATRGGVTFNFELKSYSPIVANWVAQAISWPNQSPSVLGAFDALDEYGLSIGRTSFTQANPKYNAYKNFSQEFSSFEKKVNSTRDMYSTILYVLNNVTNEERELITNRKRYVLFDNPRYTDEGFVADGIRLVETEEARAQRVLLEKLEAARKARYMNIDSVSIKEDGTSISYRTDDSREFNIQLETMISW